MGLAASQARLLTITSRLSSVELKQQRIAMDKMRLANDQDGVSEKYTNALNNKTLSISNGSEEIPMNYSTLAAQGYSVVRASDGLAPYKGNANNTTIDSSGNKVVTKPTCPRPEEYTAAERVQYDYNLFSEEKKAEAKKWDTQLNTFKSTYGDYPTSQTVSMNEMLKKTSLGYNTTIGSAFSSGNSFNKNISSKTLYDIANPSGGEKDYVVLLAQDGGKVGGVPMDAAKKKFTEIGNTLIPKIAQTLGITSANDSFTNEMKKYVETLKNNITFSDRNRERDTNKAYEYAVNEARSGLVGNLTETYKKGSDNDGYMLNLSEMVRRLMQKAVSYYTASVSTETQVLNKKTNTSNMDSKLTLTISSKGYSQKEWLEKAKELFDKQKYTSMNWNEALKVAEKGYDKATSEKGTYTTPESEYQEALNTYNRNVADAKAQWDAYDAYINGDTTNNNASKTESSTTTPAEEFYNQLQNSQFLIQGILSGYLTLMKDGQQVSLSSATDIIESYDKTDDAAAEAEYNAQMNKINRKEKILDMQAKRLDTEYSALTNEYNSIKSIIDNHTQKDFSYFS